MSVQLILRVESKRYGGIFDYDTKSERLIEVKRELEDPEIWSQPERAQSLGKERSILEDIVCVVDELTTGLYDLDALLAQGNYNVKNML